MELFAYHNKGMSILHGNKPTILIFCPFPIQVNIYVGISQYGDKIQSGKTRH